MANIQVEILLVEDNPNDVELTLHALNHNNISNQIHVVRDGAEALDYLFCKGEYKNRIISDGPKLILLDLKLPKITGLEVLEKIRANQQTRCLPVVILTSSDEEQDIAAGYKLGVNSYIRKPINFEKFSEVIRRLGYYWLVLNVSPPFQSNQG